MMSATLNTAATSTHATHATPAAGPFPRRALIAVGALLMVAVLGAAAVRIVGVDIRTPDAAASVTRELRFEDRADGSVAVIDARSGSTIDTVNGEAGFFRGTLRGLARERRRMGFGPEAAFHLIGRADGRLTLADPATGQRVDLASFGPTNAAIFARFLSAR
ncbi:MAG: photosynthetic complex assembly protein PuhC [Methylibium sp. NZG]|nr:MAG: photosynthetic complex assembly protein PuhC [Methylibium sp. NZG]